MSYGVILFGNFIMFSKSTSYIRHHSSLMTWRLVFWFAGSFYCGGGSRTSKGWGGCSGGTGTPPQMALLWSTPQAKIWHTFCGLYCSALQMQMQHHLFFKRLMTRSKTERHESAPGHCSWVYCGFRKDVSSHSRKGSPLSPKLMETVTKLL